MIKKKEFGKIHPEIPGLIEKLEKKKIGRRDFLRTSTLLGLSAGAAYTVVGQLTGAIPGLVRSAYAQTPKTGGVLKVSMEVQEMTDPATFDWVQKSNVARHIGEYLTMWGPDNVCRPYLAESWKASEDLTEWTFKLRKGIQWHNGDTFNADDVLFNFTRWLDPKTGSSNIGLFAAMVEEYDTGEKDKEGKPKMSKRMIDGALTKVDDYTVKLKTKTPQLSIPENLYNYPTMIMHRDFEKNGKDFSKHPIGTGPYTLTEFKIGERATLKRTDRPYWGKDLDNPFIGGPIYLDEIQYLDHGSASTAQLAAYASGQVDAIYEFDVAAQQMAQSLPDTNIHTAITTITVCLRMRVTEKPFDNKKLRQAIQACADVDAYSTLIFGGRAAFGEHHHVAQIHPEYFELPKPKQDIAKAKRLLAEAGFPNGLDLTMDIGNTSGPWQTQCGEIFKEQLAKAGINLKLNVMPSSKFWEIWDKTPFGMTEWTHRPLGVMVLSLGYRSGVPWNESAYSNPAFDKALDEAESIVDPAARSKKMAEVERILQEDAVMVQPVWVPKFTVAHKKVMNFKAHPTQYHLFHRVWLNT